MPPCPTNHSTPLLHTHTLGVCVSMCEWERERETISTSKPILVAVYPASVGWSQHGHILLLSACTETNINQISSKWILMIMYYTMNKVNLSFKRALIYKIPFMVLAVKDIWTNFPCRKQTHLIKCFKIMLKSSENINIWETTRPRVSKPLFSLKVSSYSKTLWHWFW